MRWHYLSILLGKLLPFVGIGLLAGIAYFSIRKRKAVHRRAAKVLSEAVATEAHEPTTLHPEINAARCAGCGACVRACPEGDILQMINHKAVLVSPTKCVGHGECEAACPFAAIDLVFGTKTRGMEMPRITTNFETNVPGLYIAGELGGMGLIRNAIKQGRMAVEHAVKQLPAVKGGANVDFLVVGAGAAGLSASLAALQAKKSYLCIEQDSVGGTIFNFPRQKIVMTQPADLPLVGLMKFPRHKVSKEELLAYWHGVRKKTGLKIKEGTKFIGLERRDDGLFAVETSKGPIVAKKVILSMGVRGTPRKLGIPNEDMAKVTYNLLEPEQYQGLHIAVVGGGNAGVEAACSLAQQRFRNKVTLLVRGPSLSRCNSENQAIVQDLARKRLVKIVFNAAVAEIQQSHLVVSKEGVQSKIPNDFLFIFAGAEMPFKFLNSLGIQIDKKYGEAR